MKRKLLVVLLALAMLVTLTPMAAFAEEGVQNKEFNIEKTETTATGVYNRSGFGVVSFPGPYTEGGDEDWWSWYGLVGSDGNYIIPAKPNAEYVKHDSFGNTFFVTDGIICDYKKGYYNLDGTKAFDIDFFETTLGENAYLSSMRAMPFYDGNALVQFTYEAEWSSGGAGGNESEESPYYLINSSGDVVAEHPADSYSGWYYGGEGLAMSPLSGDGVVYYDYSGNTVLDLTGRGYAGYAGAFFDGFAWVKNADSGKSGFINRDGEEVIPCEYDSVGSYAFGLFPVKKDGMWGLVNSANEVVIPFEYEDAFPFADGLACVKMDGKYGVIDLDQNIVINCEWDDMSSFNEDVGYAIKDGYLYTIKAVEVMPEPELHPITLWAGSENIETPEIRFVEPSTINVSSVTSSNEDVISVLVFGEGSTIWDYGLLPEKSGTSTITISFTANGKEYTVSAVYTVKDFPVFLSSLTVDGEAISADDYNNTNFYDIYNYKGTSPKVEFTIADGWTLYYAYAYSLDEAGEYIDIYSGEEYQADGWVFDFPEGYEDLNTFYNFNNDEGDTIQFGVHFGRGDGGSSGPDGYPELPDGTVYVDDNGKLNWTPVEGADHYFLYIADRGVWLDESDNGIFDVNNDINERILEGTLSKPDDNTYTLNFIVADANDEYTAQKKFSYYYEYTAPAELVLNVSEDGILKAEYPGAEDYRVTLITDNGNVTWIETGNQLVFDLREMIISAVSEKFVDPAETDHKFRVSAVIDDVTVATANTSYVYTVPEMGKVENITYDSESGILSWDKVDSEIEVFGYILDIDGYSEFCEEENVNIENMIDIAIMEGNLEAPEDDNYTIDVYAIAGRGTTLAKGTYQLKYTSEAEPEADSVTRIAGKSRYLTSLMSADAYREQLGLDKFDNVIVACGTNYADALAGSYLSIVKEAPILLVRNRAAEIELIQDYIKENLNEGGTIYILGGTAVVPDTIKDALEGYNGFKVKRLKGKDRYATNVEILKEAGISGDEIIVASGIGFADSLSASALGKPVLLVKGTVQPSQEEYIKSLAGKHFCLIGGKGAVSEDMNTYLKGIGTTERISGKNRYETSAKVAERFFGAPEGAVLAYGEDYPDGLCGGSLANAIGGPLLLSRSGRTNYAADFAKSTGIKSGFVLGGKTLISDDDARTIFQMSADGEIIVK